MSAKIKNIELSMLEARGLVHLLDLRIADMEAIREDIEAFQRKNQPSAVAQRIERLGIYEPELRSIRAKVKTVYGV